MKFKRDHYFNDNSMKISLGTDLTMWHIRCKSVVFWVMQRTHVHCMYTFEMVEHSVSSKSN